MRKVILLTAMPKERVWSSSIYVNGGGKLLSSKISFSRILLLFVCCIFCNNVFAQNDDWRLVQDFESLTNDNVKACKFDGTVVANTVAISEISSQQGQGKAGKFSKIIGYDNQNYGIVFPVSLGSKQLKKYSKIKLDIYYENGDFSYKPVIVGFRNGESGPFGYRASRANEHNDKPETVTGFELDLNFDENCNYTDFEIFVSIGDNTNPLQFQIDNIQLYGPAIASSPVEIEIDETQNNTITAKKYDTVRLYRTLTAGMWNTICLPFAPTEDQAKTIFGTEAKFAQFSSVSNGVMQFTSVDFDDLQAGTPYLVLPSQDKTTDSPIVLTGVIPL